MAQHNPQEQIYRCHFRCLPVKNWEEKIPIWHCQCHCLAILLQICHYKCQQKPSRTETTVERSIPDKNQKVYKENTESLLISS